VNSAVRGGFRALVVAADDAVRDVVIGALRAVGMGVVSTEHVDECIGKIPAGPSLVVLHPDRFRFDQIVGILFALRRERPDVHAVLVTESPDRYAKLIVVADNASPPSVIPLPALGGTIGATVATTAAADAQRRMQAAASDGANVRTGSR